MPICRGCEEKILYQNLDIHQRYCNENHSGTARTSRPTDPLEPELSAVQHRLNDALERERERLREGMRNLKAFGIQRSIHRR